MFVTKRCLSSGPAKKYIGEGKDMVIRDKIFSTITDVFKRHGAVTIDTWVLHLIGRRTHRCH